jgi:hypothetical protein
MRPLPAGSHLCLHGAYVLSAVGPFINWSEDADPWLYQAGGFDHEGVWKVSSQAFGEDITMLAPVQQSGLYVGTDYGLFYIAGYGSDDSEIKQISENSPEFGSVCFRKDNGNPVWYTKDGLVEGKAGGEVVTLSNQAAVSMDTSGSGGAALTLMSLNGTQIAISIPQNPVRGRLQARDWNREIYRRTSAS